jgi:hypothetical protein
MSDELTEETREVLRKIGRNVVLFQELERILKSLLAVQYPSTPVSKLKKRQEKRLAKVRKRSLGHIADRLHKTLFTDGDTDSITPAAIKEPTVSASFRLEADESIAEAAKLSLSSLIDERNKLIHHLLERWDMLSLASTRSIDVHLDQQRQRILGEIDTYKRFRRAISEMGKELQHFLYSEEGTRQFDLAFLQQSQVAQLLVLFATQSARPDGWTDLSAAGAYLHHHAYDETTRLKRKYGKGSLRKLVLATELFDDQSEGMQSGGFRVLYRMKRTANGLV